MCWVATDSVNTASTCSNLDGYTGCKRTVCDWWASNLACEAMGWRLPTKEEVAIWRIKFGASTYYDSLLWENITYNRGNYLNLCDSTSGYNANQCLNVSNCKGSPDHCDAYHIWTSSATGNNIYAYYLAKGKLIGSTGYVKTYPWTARCVSGKYPTCVAKYGAYCTECDNSQCTACASGYTLINDSSVTGGTRCVKTVTPHSSYVTNFQKLPSKKAPNGANLVMSYYFLFNRN